MIGQLIANGIVYGCIIALAAIGLSLSYRIMNFANFAHGDFLTLGAYLTLFFAATLNLGFPVACILQFFNRSNRRGLDFESGPMRAREQANRIMILSWSVIAIKSVIIFPA